MISNTTANKILLAGSFLFAATSVSLAQDLQRDYYGYGPYAGYADGYYSYGPVYGDGFHDSDRGPAYHMRGGPGPRVGNGTGMGIGAER